MQMHVGAVEQRIALRQHGHGAAGCKVFGYFCRGFFVEGEDLRLVVGMVLVDLGGDGIVQRQFHRARPDMALDDGAGIAVGIALGEMRHDIGLSERAHGLQRQQFGVAGAGADADQPADGCLRAHRPGLASALRAAAVMALPPSLPRTMA